MEPELPKPDSEELKKLVNSRESRVIYGYLYERRDDPPTQAEIDEFVAREYGVRHSQTQRRRRALKTDYGFDVRGERVPGKRDEVYRLAGYRPDFTPGSQIDLATRAKVLHDYHERCAMCGRNPTEHGVVLHIDHKIPKDWGGHPTDEENLWPLCEYCNLGKKALFANYDAEGEAIAAAIRHDDPWTRIGELLKALQGQEVPDYLLFFVAREENQGDYKKRARELRFIMGWDIQAKKRRDVNSKKTLSFYVLHAWEPWPAEGARAAVNAYEAARKRCKAGSE
ncbi:MAG: HNH endonuclease signature motif containing protein [Coriobacteriia bacterium]